MARALKDENAVAAWRSSFAEELRVVAGMISPALINAFARVPRERFVGEPPWYYAAGIDLRNRGAYCQTSSVQDLYHDVVVALKLEERLNTAQPSVMARLLEALDLEPGQRVLHIGCGTGYYSAILAEAVGRTGSVVSVEVDPELARQAMKNLKDYPSLRVLLQDGALLEADSFDRILMNASVTTLPQNWLRSLPAGGILVAPFIVGREPESRESIALRFVRKKERFAAEPVTTLAIFPCSSLRLPAMQEQLADGVRSRQMLQLKSLRMNAHQRTESCIVHGEQMCLSEEPAEGQEAAIDGKRTENCT